MTIKPAKRRRTPVRRPRVAGRNRPTARANGRREVTDPVPEPASQPEVDEEVAVEAEESTPRRPGAAVVLILVAAVLAGLGVFFMVEARSAETVGNVALLDTRATTEVNGQVKNALERIFSFSYDNVDATGNAARQVLAGTAVGEYEKLIDQVKAEAPAQKLVLSTKVTTAGVRMLDGDRAQLLVFLDQVATRVDTDKTSGSAAALTVKAERQDDIWKINELVPR
ncbi:hypothetical protein GCM10012275_34870 [Longimycelium tulufanense]|uniref:Mce-associated membrane protein n=1 Tax=Longimycelium tulufanense TaxID=907463 RepID=A0A8J3CFI0_9PSEU|nr:hypothetical protein [Longimycelium tulufanense]GGM60844.1 hypothetical protein GCM10012275_34870 [Longimycelium tulufanense]